jgi:Ca2+-transporting ATPase
MALGAWRLMKFGVIVKQTKTVETLGSASVICTDKTGTITRNEMALARLYVYPAGKILDIANSDLGEGTHLMELAMWSSEPIPFDPMEKALHQAYEKYSSKDLRPDFRIVHEYSLSGSPPMMTHVFANAPAKKLLQRKVHPRLSCFKSIE